MLDWPFGIPFIIALKLPIEIKIIENDCWLLVAYHNNAITSLGFWQNYELHVKYFVCLFPLRFQLYISIAMLLYKLSCEGSQKYIRIYTRKLQYLSIQAIISYLSFIIY